MQATLLSVGGRTYRVQHNFDQPQPQQQPQRGQAREDLYTETTAHDDDDGQPQESVSFSADQVLFPALIGRGGAARKALEEASGAQIIFPRQPNADSEIKIKGSQAAVQKATLRLQIAIDSLLQSRQFDYNFFISIPLATPSSIQLCRGLQSTILAESSLDPKACMPPEHLHLTIGMLKLYSQDARSKACLLLKELQPEISALLAGQPLQTRLQGLEIMNDDSSAVDVLYLQVKPVTPNDTRLDQLCQLLVRVFHSAGLLQDNRPVKKHVTLLNTRYAMQPNSPRQSFDARDTMKKCGSSADLGVIDVSSVHISRRGAFDAATGYYELLDQISVT